jgi:hypothetical protein
VRRKLRLVAARLILLCLAAFAANLPSAGKVDAAPPGVAENTDLQAICGMIDKAAAANRLPSALLARILWQESRFRNDATSPAGAEGVAQFMRPTAAARGLADPRDPEPAIAASARLLAELTVRFGNVGLGAAAYNAGASRIAKWLRAESDLPLETRLYVRGATGYRVEDWAMHPEGRSIATGATCLQTIIPTAALVPERRRRAVWQVRLEDSLALLAGLRAVRPAQQAAPNDLALAFCGRLRSLGARCDVYNP